ncbi:Ferrous iron transport protein B [Aquisphaera giovannonii]|uniref:Ferrous iron transport protein B n=1 Tax=Aquisphaera giovannonii TaxID=406548 RepID=A0A5B9VWR8_9BACT|nr:ferrous iron transport protein B [Aquisphaera giovannonii]QEH32692.1 Ferrous iron transport protein B [Aquisphaera giovannonii]
MQTATARKIRTIALVGNPNTGKSTLFGGLSGVPQRVGNYPGVTVEKTLGEVQHAGEVWTLVDLPGTYSLAPRSPDEMVAVDVLFGRLDDVPVPDVVLCVAAANNLERNLYLLSQVLEVGRPVVLALTMWDVAQDHGLRIDVPALSERLGVPVVPVEAHRGIGLESLKDALAEAGRTTCPAAQGPFPPAFLEETARLAGFLSSRRTLAGEDRLPRYLVERLLLDTGGYLEGRLYGDQNGDGRAVREELEAARGRLAAAGCTVPGVETTARYGWIARAVSGIVHHPDAPASTWGDRLDAVLTHRFWGLLALAAVLLLMFSAVFSWAQGPMDAIDAGIGWVSAQLQARLPEGPLLSLLTDGIIGGIGAVVVFLPQIFILFFLLTSLEECGYLSRAAYLMDRLMVRVGLSGKSFIPLLSSFACAIPGVMATRVIEDRRDRLTTILIAPLMSCSARLPVYTLMIAAFIPDRRFLGGLLGLQGLVLFAMYAVGIVVAAVAALILKRTLLRGEAPSFLMEMPPYKWPSPRVVVHRMLERGWDFLRNAGTIIFAVSIVMWGALYYPRLSTKEMAPLAAEKVRLEAEREGARVAGDAEKEELAADGLADVANRIEGAQKRQSVLGRLGHLIEPAVRPLGWDWRIGSGVIASFPAREVVVATLGVIFDVGREVEEDEGSQRLGDALRSATWPSGKPLFDIPVALSIMVFFALCAQCVSTLAVIGRETGTWTWPAFTFAYMTAVAYVAALLVYQGGTWLGL